MRIRIALLWESHIAIPTEFYFLVSNRCAMYCRHCTRKRVLVTRTLFLQRANLGWYLLYRKHREIRDVLISGGDPFMLPDDYLDWILTELNRIRHIQVIRIGSRVPVVLPYSVTNELVHMLKKHHPIWLNTHFNHPRELTLASRKALRN